MNVTIGFSVNDQIPVMSSSLFEPMATGNFKPLALVNSAASFIAADSFSPGTPAVPACGINEARRRVHMNAV